MAALLLFYYCGFILKGNIWAESL